MVKRCTAATWVIQSIDTYDHRVGLPCVGKNHLYPQSGKLLQKRGSAPMCSPAGYKRHGSKNTMRVYNRLLMTGGLIAENITFPALPPSCLNVKRGEIKRLQKAIYLSFVSFNSPYSTNIFV
jgi:hypothetical protein